MTDKKNNTPEIESKDEKLEKRRKALKSILAGSGTVVTAAAMQDKWAKPVIESVVLPAHAQTSGGVYSGTGLLTTGSIEDGEATLLAELTDTLLPQAEAQAGGQFYACATVAGSVANVVIAGLNDIDNLNLNGVKLIRRGALTLPTGAGPGPEGAITATGSDVSPCTPDRGGSEFNRPARIVSISDTEIRIEVLTQCDESEGGCNRGLILNVPSSNTGCLPEPLVHSGACPTTSGPGTTLI